MKKNRIALFVLVIVLVGFLVRLYRISNPLADWHAWRQADTSAISKRFVQNGINPLRPTYFDISNIQSGKDNPRGYRMVEFPLFNVIHAGVYSAFPLLSLEVWGRLLVAFLYCLSGVFFFLFTAKKCGEKVGFFVLFYYLFLPFGIFYTRAILPDPFMISLCVTGIYTCNKFLEGKRRLLWFVLSFVFISSSILVKPYAVFFLPVYLALVWEQYRWGATRKITLYVLAAFSIIPFILWRWWIGHFPEGIPASSWLFNEGNIRFKGAFFYWVFGERIGKLILGYFGSGMLLSGLLMDKKNNLLTYSFLASSLLYITVIARGNVQHDYYQIFLLPTIALIVGRGAGFIIESQKKQIGYVFVGIFTLLSFALSWYYIRDYFNINNVALVHAGERADEILPKSARVIAPFDGDTSLLYYINRPGWPTFQRSIEELIQMGATHLVIVNPTENDFSGFGTDYKILDSSGEYLILDLTE